MATYYADFDSTPANLVATLKTEIVKSTDWTNITGNIMKATTTRGAEMVVDLTDAAITSMRMQCGVYRTHNGTTGTDKVIRYVAWKATVTGATTDILHVQLSVGKEHFYLAVEGPRQGEPNPDDSSNFTGSMRQPLFLGDIVPYFASDTVPAVLLLGNTASTAFSSETVHVSRNAANSASWVPARLGTMTMPKAPTDVSGVQTYSPRRECSADGNTYLWPWVVLEDTAGIRGRIAKCFFAGFNKSGGSTDAVPSLYARSTYGGETYMLVAPHKSAYISGQSRSGFGYVANGGNPLGQLTDSPLIAVLVPAGT